MARTSRKNQKNPSMPEPERIQIWKTAFYARLSVEDNGKESDSVNNQISLLEKYVSERPYLKKAAIYIDNGYTGTNFDEVR